ncbi:MAG TPA: UDP-3-O-(3-hydroxymyristoyl)glucosamine N-acyltransferase [Methylomirabilota bacterium]|nr:UDP-3-O-(3-hydroxymyristoyl)glucosamine N-acyltransferase [Methylomirabilota bacterium]
MAAGGSFTLGELAETLNARLEGEPSRRVRAVATLEAAGPDDISFVLGPRYVKAAAATRAGALVAPEGLAGLPGAVLRVAAPQAALIALLRLFHPDPPLEPGTHRLALVADGARVDASAAVGPFAVVERGARIGRGTRVGALCFVGEDAVVGDDVLLHPRVVVRSGVRIGNRVIVHPGAVLGADGFGYAFDGQGHRKIPQVGGVRIEDDVEIGANTTVDRATLGETVIGRGSKLDNLVQVGHNCQIGEDVILVSQVGVSGSSKVGHRAVLAGQVGIADHVEVGEGAVLTAKSGVPNDIPAGEVWSGIPARPTGEAKRIWAAENRLPELLRRVRDLEKRLTDLEKGAK